MKSGKPRLEGSVSSVALLATTVAIAKSPAIKIQALTQTGIILEELAQVDFSWIDDHSRELCALAEHEGMPSSSNFHTECVYLREAQAA